MLRVVITDQTKENSKISKISKNELVKKMESDLVQITGSLRDSGLKVNEAKTELYLFYKKDMPMITINFGDTTISSASSMNILGVNFS